MDCLVARALLQRPDHRRNWLVELRRITFEFVSPADGGRRRAALVAAPHYRQVRPGDVVPILAHRLQPDRIGLPRRASRDGRACLGVAGDLMSRKSRPESQ